MTRDEYLAEVDKRTAALPDLGSKLAYLQNLRDQLERMERRAFQAAADGQDCPDAFDLSIIDGALAIRAERLKQEAAT